MKILFAIKGMNYAKGGAERVIATITKEMVKRGHEVSLITFDMPGGQSFYTLDPSVKRLSLGLGDATEKSTFWDTCRRIYALREVIMRDPPDAVIAFMHSMYVPMSFALAGTGIPVIASEHIVPAHYRSTPIQYLSVLLSAFFIVSRFTVISQNVKKLYPWFIRHRISVVSNPVFLPPGARRQTEEHLKQRKGKKVLLNVGRLNPQKDQFTLIRAFAKLVSKYPDWELRIIGEGELKADLDSCVRMLGLQDKIHIPGATKDIAPEYKHADVFVIPSLYESFGLATAEAMSFGLPPIGFSDCPGTNELIVDGYNGMLVDGGGDRVSSLAKGLDILMSDKKKRVEYGHNARSIIEKFRPEKIAGRWEILINDVLKRRRKYRNRLLNDNPA